MFNLFKAKETTQEVIEKIHNEFNGAGEVLLCEAKRVLKKSVSDKAVRLEKAGFKLAKGVAEAKQTIQEQEEHRKTMEMVNYYTMNYPNQKFITEEIVKKICAKYGLVCAPVDRFKGFVPEEKLKMIEGFSIKENDVGELKIKAYYSFPNTQDKDQVKRLRRMYPDDIIPFSLLQNGGITKFYEVGDNWGQISVRNYDSIDNKALRICAPASQFDTNGLTKFGHQLRQVTKVEIPDPVVLQPCKGGYLIICAWGDEASDEMVVNPKDN